MAESVNAEVNAASDAPGQPAASLPRARWMAGDRHIARVLKMGAVLAGACFASSIALELLPPSAMQGYMIDVLRKGGVMMLVATPIIRLVAAGVMLGLKGEWRYTLFAVCILMLLSLAIGLGLSA